MLVSMSVVALGCKNHLFCGFDVEGHSATAIYSLIGTAKINGIEPALYLQRILERIPLPAYLAHLCDLI